MLRANVYQKGRGQATLGTWDVKTGVTWRVPYSRVVSFAPIHGATPHVVARLLMLSPRLIPTRLLSARPSHIIKVDVHPVSRLRTVTTLFALLYLVTRLVALRLRGPIAGDLAGRMVRETFERLGGLWLKAGQLLSLRVDLFPLAFCHELATLQNQSVAFPTPVARRILEKELGAPVEHYFDEFGDRPFAVASIGQVYRARLRREQVYVAVKIQKPYSAELFARDLMLIRWIVLIVTIVRFRSHMRWDLGHNELCEVMKEELDYNYEASAVRRMRRALRGHRIYVPRLFARYSTQRVLVTEFIHAILMADYIRVANEDPERLAGWLTENNVNPRKVARRLIHSMYRQLFENNFFHGDLHPGNIVLLRNSRIALIDFGTTSFTERDYLQKFVMFVRALATRDYAKAADLSLLLTASLPNNLDVDQAKDDLVRALRSWATRTFVKQLPYHAKSMDNITIEVMRILVECRCTMEWGWLRIHRAMTTLDTSLVYLHRHVNYTRMLQQYFRKAERRKLRAMVNPAFALRQALATSDVQFGILDRINEYTLFQSTLVRRQSQVFRGTVSKISAVLRAGVQLLSGAIALVGLVGLLVFVDQRWGSAALDRLGPQLSGWIRRAPSLDTAVWAVLALSYAFFVATLMRLRRRLRQRDSAPHEKVAAV
jgi:ubiquinone biosynthesis protein